MSSCVGLAVDLPSELNLYTRTGLNPGELRYVRDACSCSRRDFLRRKGSLLRALVRPRAAISHLTYRGRQDLPIRAILPFATDIPIRSYLNQALPLSIVSRDPNHRTALFGSFLQLFFPDHKLEYDRVLMLPSLRAEDWRRLSLLDISIVDTHAAELTRPGALVDLLIEHLRQGHYAEMQIDEYFLPGRPCFRTVHSVHDNLILGYDLNRNFFDVAGYGQDYEVAGMRFEDIEKAFHHMPRSALGRRYLAMMRLREGAKPEFDLAGMTAQLGDYLHSRITMAPDVMRNANLYWKARRFTGAWGLDTYEAFIDYVTRMGRGRKALDLRATRTLWEHKACMLARLKFLQEKQCLAKGQSWPAYAAVVDLAKAVRFEAYEYNTAGPNPNCIDSMTAILRTMRDMEAEVLRPVHAALVPPARA